MLQILKFIISGGVAVLKTLTYYAQTFCYKTLNLYNYYTINNLHFLLWITITFGLQLQTIQLLTNFLVMYLAYYS